MASRTAPWQPDQGAAVSARTAGALALVALAVIHVVDLPGALGPDRLVGIGYLGIIAAAVVMSGVLITRWHRLAWAAAAAVAVSAMGGYVLTCALPGGFLGDHADVGNWRCPLGIAALSVESVIAALDAGQARMYAASVATGSQPVAGRGRVHPAPMIEVVTMLPSHEVVLLHGQPGSRADWQQVTAQLPATLQRAWARDA